MWTYRDSHLLPASDLYLRAQTGGGAVLLFSPRGLDTPVTLPPPPHYRIERVHKTISGVLGMKRTTQDRQVTSMIDRNHVQ
jgi:hypothetical protein